jgi:hypothetical protein
MPLFASVCLLHSLRDDYLGLRVIILRAQCLADLKACRQTNIPIYSFTEHQRLDEKKYLYGAAIILGSRPFFALVYQTHTEHDSGRDHDT